MTHRFLSLIFVVVTFLFAIGCKKDDTDKKPILSTAQVTDILPITATCGGNITNDGGSGVSARGVVWSTSINPTLENNEGKTNDGSSGVGSFVSNLKALTPSTSYYVRAYATNSAGTGYGMDMSFTTEARNGTFIDQRDGHVYTWVKIGTQVWMAENLKYLPSVVGPGSFSDTIPNYYVYGYNDTSVTAAKTTANYNTYGVLYSLEAAKAAVPSGWHLPSDVEWDQLRDYLCRGCESVVGGELKETGTTHWADPNAGATNRTGFTALPGGYRDLEGAFVAVGFYGSWWSVTEVDNAYAWGRHMRCDYASLERKRDNKVFGFSVRCIRD